MAAYNNNEDSPNDPDGVALIWNTKFKKTTPEYVFHCQSAVMSAKFAKFHPNLILGGTYSGQIVLWDNRVQKRTPIQRTPLSAAAHTVSGNACFFYCFNSILINTYMAAEWILTVLKVLSHTIGNRLNLRQHSYSCCV